jgi:hypothetical protein
MRPNHHGVPHLEMKRRKRFIAILLLALAVSASGQASKPVPSTVHHKLAGHPRKPTLPELYEMFFTFAAHVETRSEADTKRGLNRTFYRKHLQTASGLDSADYAFVLASALRFAAVDAELKTERAAEIKARRQYPAGAIPKNQLLAYQSKMKSLVERHSSSLNGEIAKVRQELGEERAQMFETYLQTKYALPKIGVVAAATKSLALKHAGINAADTVVFNSGDSCSDDFDLFDDDDDYFGFWNICADAQISYLGSPETDEAEFFASISWDTANVEGDWDIPDYSTEGDFFVDGSEHDNLDCAVDDETSCHTDAQLTSGNDVSYDWNSTGEVTLDFDFDCDDEGDYCFEDTQIYTSDDASVVILFPDINTLSQSTFNQGSSGTFTIDGQYLESAFENPPTVTVADQSTIFSRFEVSPPTSYPDGDITITYTVSADAPPGTYGLTVNNGFGSDTFDITISPPPSITSVSVNGVAGGPLQADTSQTVVLTGTNFGTDSAPTVNVATDGQYVTAGAVSAHTATSATFTATTSIEAPSGTASFQLVAPNGQGTSPAVNVLPVMLAPPQIMMVTSTAALQTCTGGTEIDGQTTPVYAGQAILLCSPAPVLPAGATYTSPAWSVINPVDLTGGYCAPGAFSTCPVAGSGQEFPDPAMSGVTSIGFYWVNPDSTETVTFQYCINNSSTQCISSQANFDISGPTQTPGASGAMWTVTNLVTVSGPPYLAFGIYNATGKLATAGISFFNGETAPTDNLGSFQWVQTINTDQYTKLLPTATQLCVPVTRKPGGPDPEGIPELDNVYPYPMNSAPNTLDAPGSSLLTEGEQQHPFSATMYLMWDPALNLNGTACTAATDVPVNGALNPKASTCSGSIPIPLAAVTWEWAGCAINTLNPAIGVGGWTVQGGCVNWIPSTSVGPNGSYPQWTYTSLNQVAGGPATWTCSNVTDEASVVDKASKR